MFTLNMQFMLASWCLSGFEVHQYFFVFLVVNPFFLIVEYCFVL